jgi:hypothetical protein
MDEELSGARAPSLMFKSILLSSIILSDIKWRFGYSKISLSTDGLRKEGIGNAVLAKAAQEVEAGRVGARLGGFLIKKRVPKSGTGKRGGYQTILAHRQGDRMFFLEGYAKNEKSDLEPAEQKALIMAGDVYMKLTDAGLDVSVKMKKLLEVTIR